MNTAELYHRISGVAWESDSRKPVEGKTFLALKGDRFDGNAFIEQALENGARFVLSDDIKWKDTEGVFVVSDVLNTITELAAFHRKNWEGKMIAVAGSNGKTTTKELMYAALSPFHQCFATPGNFNNHIGVPLSLWQLGNEHSWAIIEIGANHLGETQHLSNLCAPDYGIITNHGKDHLEGFGSEEGVRKANNELFDYLEISGKYALVNGEDEKLMEDSKRLKRYIYGHKESHFLTYSSLQTANAGIKILPEGLICSSQLAGGFNAVNIAAALCLAKIAGVPLEKAAESVKNYKPSLLRSQQLVHKGIRVRLDAYNANPSSMELSILSFVKETPGPHCLLLADMLEMGEFSDNVHMECVALLQKLNLKEVWLIGPAFTQAVKNTPDCRFKCFLSRNDIPEQTLPAHWEGCDVLIKGSRRFALEKTLES